MILSYIDLLGDGKRHKINAEVTTDHPASHYGQPVIVLDDGGSLDLSSWVLLNYQVVKATPDELAGVKQMMDLLNLMTGGNQMTPAEMGRKGGSATSPLKAGTSRENGRKGGRPKKIHPGDENDTL